ncbi:MAG: hypothetical protein QM740_21400 [Acidovorax sp.]
MSLTSMAAAVNPGECKLVRRAHWPAKGSLSTSPAREGALGQLPEHNGVIAWNGMFELLQTPTSAIHSDLGRDAITTSTMESYLFENKKFHLMPYIRDGARRFSNYANE